MKNIEGRTRSQQDQFELMQATNSTVSISNQNRGSNAVYDHRKQLPDELRYTGGIPAIRNSNATANSNSNSLNKTAFNGSNVFQMGNLLQQQASSSEVKGLSGISGGGDNRLAQYSGIQNRKSQIVEPTTNQ